MHLRIIYFYEEGLCGCYISECCIVATIWREFVENFGTWALEQHAKHYMNESAWMLYHWI